MLTKTNKDLKTIYESIYEKGAANVFTKSEEHEFVLKSNDWKDKTILDVGCGEGDFDLDVAKWGGALYPQSTIQKRQSRKQRRIIDTRIYALLILILMIQ